MNQEDILTLARAGFSRAEILAMIQPEPQPATDPVPAAPQPEPQPATDPAPAAPKPEPQPAADPVPAAPQPVADPVPAAPQPAAPQQPSNQDLFAAISSLTAAIQNINRNSAQQPGQKRLTGDDVMAGFIRPPRSDNK